MREKNYFVWMLLAAMLLALLNLPVSFSRKAKAALRETLAPLHGLLAGVGVRLREAGSTFRGYGGMVKENREMGEELVRLRNEARLLKAAERENERLREQLGFMSRSTRRLVACEVLARDVSGWWQTVRLNKGLLEGLAPDQAVLTADGLAGRTVDVSSRTCEVLLLSDPNCRVSAQLVRTGAYGVVTGRGLSAGGQVICLMEFINRNLPVRPGDEVVTSGLGGVFPSGLLIGYIEEVELDDAGLYQRATVIPRADLGMMSHVFVLVPDRDDVDRLWRAKRRAAGEPDEPDAPAIEPPGEAADAEAPAADGEAP